MIEVGRICIKLAGRDAGKKCVVVEVLDDNFVMIDGETRRRKCNIIHLEPLNDVIKIKSKASHSDVVSEFKKLGIEIKEKKSKKSSERPKKVRKKKEKSENNEELSKKVEKAEKPKAEKKTEKKEEKKPAKAKEAKKALPKKSEKKS